MNRTKTILAATGGVILVAVLAMAYMVWSSFSAKTAAREGDEDSGTDGLDQVMERARSLSSKKPYPCAASVKQIVSNRTTIAAWKEEAFRTASRGDRPQPPTTPAAFKEFIVGDAKRVAALPASGGPLVAADFDFGPFKDYISGGKMPVESELAALQRKWDDVATIAEILSGSGIVRLTGVAFKGAAAAEDAKDDADKGRKNQRKKRAAKRAAAKEEKPASGPLSFSYVITFLARPDALVKCVNDFATTERFVVVDDFSFARETDVIAAALGAGAKKKDAQAAQSPRRRRGRRAQAEADEEAAEAAEKNGGVITDPIADPPLSVSMTISIYDFRSLEETKEGGK